MYVLCVCCVCIHGKFARMLYVCVMRVRFVCMRCMYVRVYDMICYGMCARCIMFVFCVCRLRTYVCYVCVVLVLCIYVIHVCIFWYVCVYVWVLRMSCRFSCMYVYVRAL